MAAEKRQEFFSETTQEVAAGCANVAKSKVIRAFVVAGAIVLVLGVIGLVKVSDDRAVLRSRDEAFSRDIRGSIGHINTLRDLYKFDSAIAESEEVRVKLQGNPLAPDELWKSFEASAELLNVSHRDYENKLAAGWKMYDGKLISPQQIAEGERLEGERKDKLRKIEIAKLAGAERINKAQQERLRLEEESRRPTIVRVGGLQCSVGPSYWVQEISAGLLRSWRFKNAGLCVYVVVENVGKEPDYFFKIYLIDEDGAQYLHKDLSGWDRQYDGWMTKINPHDSVSGYIVFDVSPSRNYSVVLQKDNLGDPAKPVGLSPLSEKIPE